ncbi:MAG TPA: TatD family hydrolase [Candidatus Binataceae bacterium]
MEALVDTHCHLGEPDYCADLEQVIARAVEAGVGTIVAVGAYGAIEADRRTVEIAEAHANIFAAIGVHPRHANECDAGRIAMLRDLSRSRKVVAIGETGLDLQKGFSPPRAQEAALRMHLALAADLNLPVVIHCRDAERRLAEIVREAGMPPAGGVIHCFTGDIDGAREFAALGFYISFSGILTFKNAPKIREAARSVPDDRVLIETDGPFLAPVPYRGKRNEPAYVRKTAETLAQVRGVELSALADQVRRNAARLFRIDVA